MPKSIPNEPEQTIYFRNLSIPLKIAVIISYVLGVVWLFSFMVGFILGILGL